MSDQAPSDRRGAVPPIGRLRRTGLTLVLAIAVFFGAIASGALWNAGGRADRERAAHLHAVQAITTARAEDPPLAARQGARLPSVAPAAWEYPEGTMRSGTVDVPPRTPKGRAVTVWVDDGGVPSRPPGGAADRALASVAGGTAVAGAVAAAGAGVLALSRRRVEGRRLVAWEREWEQVEPVWSGRLRRGNGTGTGDD